jgi:hypothetical protein
VETQEPITDAFQARTKVGHGTIVS